MNITKIELCNRVAKRPDIRSKKLSINGYKNALEDFIDEIFFTMAEGYRIEIRGFGCFTPIIRKKRIGRNPRTGDIVEIPSYTAPCFKFSKEAKKIFEEKLSHMKSNEKIKITA